MNHRDTETQRDPSRSVPARDPLTESVVGAAIDVHRVLGPRLLESAYEEYSWFNVPVLKADIKGMVL